MKLQDRLDHFRDYMRNALDNNIPLEIQYYLEHYAPQVFTEEQLKDGIAERLHEEASVIRIIFDDE